MKNHIRIDYHIRTPEEPWRASCQEFDLKSDHCRSAAFDLCRQIVALGTKDRPVVAYRADRPALVIQSVFTGAKWTILENESTGPTLTRWREFTLVPGDGISRPASAPPVRSDDPGLRAAA